MEPTSNQIQLIHNELHSAYDHNSLEIMLSIKLNKRLEDLTDAHQEFPTMLMEIIKKAKMEGWLLNLLDAAVKDRPERQDLNDFVKKIKAELAPAEMISYGGNPFRAHFLRMGHHFPFVDRDDLREAVESMHMPLGQTRILLVDGSIGTGKTYINEYLTFLSSQLPSHKFFYIDLVDDCELDFSAGDLMTSIANRLGADPKSVPSKESQDARWARLLVEWLIREATKKEETWWIVIDCLQEVTLRADMKELINRLVKQIDRTNPPVRLVLLDCGGRERLPLDAQNSVKPIEISPVSEDHLVTFFRELRMFYRKNLTDDNFTFIAQQILRQTDLDDKASPDPDPKKIMLRVWREVERAHMSLQKELLT